MIGNLLYPNSALMQLTHYGSLVLTLRAVVALGALVLLCTRPPRTVAVRIFLGVAAGVLLMWAAGELYRDSLQMLDGLVFLTAGTAFGLAALESREDYRRAVDVLGAVATAAA